MADAVLVCEECDRESARLWITVWPTERDRSRHLTTDGEVVKAVLGDKLANEFPALADISMSVYTIRHRDFIIASTLCEGA